MELTHSCHVAAKCSPVIANSLGDVLQLGRTIPLIAVFRKVDFHVGAKFKSTELWFLGSKFDLFFASFSLVYDFSPTDCFHFISFIFILVCQTSGLQSYPTTKG